MIKDYFVMASRNLRRRGLRSWLTMIGIFVSIATIFTLVSLSLGLQGAIEEQFETLGKDKFFIQPKTLNLGSTEKVVLTEDDVDAIKNVRGVRDYSFATIGNGKVEFEGKTRYLQITGVPMDKKELFFETGMLEIDGGRLISEKDSNDIVLGSNFKERVFGEEVRVRKSLEINDEKFDVKGILNPVGNPQDDRIILMPMEKFREKFPIESRVDYIILQVEPGESISEVSSRVERELRDKKGQTEETQDFNISTPEELLESFGNILNIVTAFLIGIAAISLLVGATGIANTMYTSVLERTKEIGVMKAIGARNSDILVIFLIEAGLLGLVGGIIGIGLGMLAGKTIEFVAANQLGTSLLQVQFPIYLIVGCLVFAFLTGAISGLIPAWQASRTSVVDALRYE